MSLISCPSCGSYSPFFFTSKDFNRRVSEETFSHYKCPDCKLIFVAPIPSDLGKYYSDSYHFVPDSVNYMEKAAGHERYKIEIIQQFAKTGSLLEIGPSYGCFTYLAKKAGFSVDAIEMNARCCEFLEKVLGVHAIHSDDPVNALLQGGSYDVIALWHVIEHLPNAFAALEAICSRVKPGGYVVLAAPNPEAFQFHLMGRYWPHVDAPRHVMLIPMKLLAERMEHLGMKTEWVTTRDKGSLGWNTFGWEFLFSNLSSHRHLKRVLHRIGRLVAWLLSPIERLEGKGSAYTMVFKKVS
jgi:2-polyprenyl-3-methyl-5-hydroxy-6-metoxy-1,4-benzoquinol methylase